MSFNIEQIEEQIASLQKKLEELKNTKLEIVRQFTGQYFAPYQGKQYRRMESEGIPIWEIYLENKNDWVTLIHNESEQLEEFYQREYPSTKKRTSSRKSEEVVK
jgi:hypothetical protein